MASPHSPCSAVRGGWSGLVLPLRRSMAKPSRVSGGTNWMTTLSVTMRTASRSTTGTSPLSVLAACVRLPAAIAAIMAVTKPAPPAQR